MNTITEKELLEENISLKDIISFYERFDINKCDDVVVILEMANILQKDTNLPMNIWLDENGKGKYNHGARLKVQNNTNEKVQKDEFFSLSISDEPILLTKDVNIKLNNKDLRQLLVFIRLYEEELMKIWKGELTLSTFLKSINNV